LLLAAAALLAVGSLAAVVALESQRGGQVQVVAAAESRGPAASAAVLVVDVAGAVARPGVYALPAGARVADAIGAAGGYSTDVDPSRAEAQLNLAARLQDGEVIRVPRRGEAATASGAVGGVTAVGAAGLVNLNTATIQELDTLPGIGPVTAQKIVAAREQERLHSVDDLVSRKIVSATTLAKFRDRVTV
jgi:competence protein ComEA